MKKLLAGLIITGLAASASAAGIQVKDAWARATVEGMHMSGAFMTIRNDNAKKDFLIGGSSEVAERVEVHTHINDNGVMRMREVKGGIPLAAKADTQLKPGSYHIMFMGLKRPLKDGETVPVTLKFKNGKPQTVDIPVKTAPMPTADTHHHGEGSHQH